MSIADKVIKSIDRLKCFEPTEGYYLAFSGGKDSIVIKELSDMAGVKYDAHYMSTTIDPPDLIYFIREHHPDVKFNFPKVPFLQEMVKRGFPQRQRRWCCEYLKEHGGEGRTVLTGVRWAESANRAKRSPIELAAKKKEDRLSFEDNEDGRRLFENCIKRGKRIVNPIIEWTDNDVWDFIKLRGMPYCKLYDEGWKRIGCLMCPMAGKHRIVEKNRYPKIAKNFIRAFDKLYEKHKHKEFCKSFVSGEDMFNWWVYEAKYIRPSQLKLFELSKESLKE